MNYQAELDQIEERKAALDRERQHIIDSVVALSKCRGCHWMSNPEQGVVPTCRDLDNANYARRVPHVTFCRKHQELAARRAKAAAP
jgi:hypothetical protein